MATAKRQHLLSLLSLIALLLTVGCDRPEPETPSPAQAPPTSEIQTAPELQLTSQEAWQLGGDTLHQTLEASRELHGQMQAFLLTPNSEALAELRQKWRQAHNQWHRLDPFLALTGSNPGLFGGLEQLAASIEARPIQPGYLDYLEHYPHTGIVNDITLSINAQTLRTQHGLTDVSDISLGFHALEFLLWGQEGERPFTDFQIAEQASTEQRAAGLTQVDLPNNRRRDLLLLISHLLQDDLNTLLTRWRGPDSQLHQIYHRLHPAARIELIKNAAEYYLRQDAPELLTSLSTEEAHNTFAGQSLAPLAQGLEGLKQLFQQGANHLLDGSSKTETGQAWLTKLDQLINRLTQLDAEQILEPEIQTELLQQLEQLAVDLKPTELNNALLGTE